MTGAGGGLSSTGRPDGVGEKDPLKDFHQAMELQATSDQASAFRTIATNTDVIGDQLTKFEKESDASQLPGLASGIEESFEKVRVETQNFVEAMSARQKAGLKEITGRLEKAEAELGEQGKTLKASGRPGSTSPRSEVEAVRKALDNLRNQQDRLALEMGIALSDSEVAFTIPAFKTSAEIGGQRVAISSSTVISRVNGENEQNIYKIVSTVDLSDLEPNLTAALAEEFNGGERCGERYSLEDARLVPSDPASAVVASKIYAERWICSRSSGEGEIAQGSGTADVKVTPMVAANGDIKLRTEIGAIEARGFLADSFRRGTLGTKLQEKIASLLGQAIQAADFKATLPATAAEAAKVQAARFELTEAGDLGLILDGEMRMSDEQAKALANQLRERVSSRAVGGEPTLQK
jgi:hypothetical protein